MGPNAAKEEIRERIDLVDLISQYVELKPSGRNWKGLCPFHQEKTPSFNVNRETKLWRCFGCNVGGDVFSFIQRIENLDFYDALKFLADRVGVTLESSPRGRERRDERLQILQVNAVAQKWFQAQLQLQLGADAQAYLASRGLDKETIVRFGIGYAPPGWDNLGRYLAKRGISPECAISAGLAKRSDQDTIYDVFRNRIIFPIRDVVGRVIAFGGRALDPADPAKYLNSPETPVFRKGRTFYGLDMARGAIREEGFVVVVEGYMDVLALAQYGIQHAVATLGTGLTEQHANLLARYTPEICLVFDNDAAGMEATLRSVRIFENCAASVKVAPLTQGKDPDEYVRMFGAKAFRELLSERIGLVEYRIKSVFARSESEGAEGRTRAAREVASILADVPDIARRQALVAWAADIWAGPDVGRANRFEEALLQEIRRRARDTAPAQRDEWEAILVEHGVPKAATREIRRRLARAEWLEQERRRQQFLQSVDHARWGGQGPDSPWSPINSDFIAETLASTTHPLVRSAHRRERKLLVAMLSRPALATQVFRDFSPEDLLLPIHREIAQIIAEVVAKEPQASSAQVTDRLSQNEELFAEATEIAVSDEEYDVSTIENDVLLIREARALGERGMCLYGAVSEPLAPVLEGETLAELEKRLQSKLNSGFVTGDDPDYVRWIQIQQKLHGSRDLPTWDY
ncbi:MAG: DNA primase [Candidatus Zipacnadales bacterium]